MSFIKRLITVTLALLFITLPLASAAEAVFTGEDMIVVVLDPGHGGRDPGAAGVRAEAYYNLRVAEYAKAALEANGNFKVYMTRSSADEYLTLAERLWFAYTVDADCVISIHFNSSSSSAIGGVEVYGSVLDRFFPSTLAQMISSKASAAAGINNRGVFRKYDYGSTLYYWSEEYQWDIPGDPSVGGLSDYYGIITWGAKFGIPALIVEQAYLSNPNERQLAEDDEVLRRMGEADAAALIEYYTNHTHSYGHMETDMPVTCFSEGRQSEHCTVCGHRRNVTPIAAAPDPSRHIWLADGDAVAATCETDGHGHYTCRYTSNLVDKGCTQFTVHEKDDYTPAYGHDYEVSYFREVTHTEDGITTYTCKRCSSSYSETVSAEGHSFELDEEVSPTCTTDGHKRYKCPECGEEYTDVLPATGHSFRIISRTEPTCTEAGDEHRICTVCELEEDVALEATGHELIIYSEVMANCTEEGFRVTVCGRCDYRLEEIWEKTGHSFAPVAEHMATCTESGELRSACIVCGEEETVITEPLGHTNEVTDSTPPTCTEDGSMTEKCTVCGHTETTVLPATGHSFIYSHTEKEPGLFTDGSAVYTCTADPAHRESRPVRDLTVFEYMDRYPLQFALLCCTALIIPIAGVILLLRILGKKPAHARKKKKSQDKTSGEPSLAEVPDSAAAEDAESPAPQMSEKE